MGSFSPKALGSYRSGYALSSPLFASMDESLTQTQANSSGDSLYDTHMRESLRKHTGFDLPRPMMFYNKPVFVGGFFPKGYGEAKEGMVYAAAFDCVMVLMEESRVRKPNDEEYRRWFYDKIDTAEYVVNARKGRLGMESYSVLKKRKV